MSMRDVVLCLTSCFDDVVLCFAVVLCFDDVVLCFVLPSTYFVLCFDDAICFSLAIWFALRDPPREVRSVGELISLLCLSLPLLSLCLSPLEKEVLAFSFCCSFLAGRPRRTGLRLHTFDVSSSTCFWWGCKPSNRKNCALRAAFCSPCYK